MFTLLRLPTFLSPTQNEILVTIPSYTLYHRPPSILFKLRLSHAQLQALRAFAASIERRKIYLCSMHHCLASATVEGAWITAQANAHCIGSYYLQGLIAKIEDKFATSRRKLKGAEAPVPGEEEAVMVLREWLKTAFEPYLTSWKSGCRRIARRTLQMYFPGLSGEFMTTGWEETMAACTKWEWIQSAKKRRVKLWRADCEREMGFALELFSVSGDVWRLGSGWGRWVGAKEWATGKEVVRTRTQQKRAPTKTADGGRV